MRRIVRWRRFGPASGNEPKLKDPFGRYVITTFVKGTNIGPYEAARHIRRFGEYSTHELGLQPEAYDPHLDVDFSPLRGEDPPAPDGYGQAA